MEKAVLEKHSELLLDIGCTLLACGANCGRINSNINRFSEALGVKSEIFYSYSGLILTAKTATGSHSKTFYKRVESHGVHFGVLTNLSLLSWQAKDEKLSYDEIKTRLEYIETLPHHPKWMVLLLVGIACAGLCLIAKGDYMDAFFSFIASVGGLFTRFQLQKRKFNPMILFISASFVTTLIASIDVVYQIGVSPEKALATSVLYLVPGVLLLNSVTDLIEGYVPTAIARGLFGGFLLLCVATGMSMGILLIGIDNY